MIWVRTCLDGSVLQYLALIPKQFETLAERKLETRDDSWSTLGENVQECGTHVRVLLTVVCFFLGLFGVAEWSGRRTLNPKSRVQFPPWPLARFVEMPSFNSSPALVSSQLVTLQPVGILCKFLCSTRNTCFCIYSASN